MFGKFSQSSMIGSPAIVTRKRKRQSEPTLTWSEFLATHLISIVVILCSITAVVMFGVAIVNLWTPQQRATEKPRPVLVVRQATGIWGFQELDSRKLEVRLQIENTDKDHATRWDAIPADLSLMDEQGNRYRCVFSANGVLLPAATVSPVVVRFTDAPVEPKKLKIHISAKPLGKDLPSDIQVEMLPSQISMDGAKKEK